MQANPGVSVYSSTVSSPGSLRYVLRYSKMKYLYLLTTVSLLGTLAVSEAIRVYSAEEVVRHLRDAAPPVGGQQTIQEISYRPYSQVPANIKQLLQFQQAREPLVHIPVQAPAQLSKTPTYGGSRYQPQVQYAGQPEGQPGPQYQQHPQAAYQQQQQKQQQQASQYRQGPQQAYNPAGNSQQLFNPQQFQHAQNSQVQQRGASGNIFTPEQRRLY